jgi:hypothetical protein
MTNFELSLLSFLIPFIYLLVFVGMNRKLYEGQRITTNALGRKGEILTVTPSHSFIKFDDESQSWYRNEMFTED